MPAHGGIPGNEAADEAVKEAALKGWQQPTAQPDPESYSSKHASKLFITEENETVPRWW